MFALLDYPKAVGDKDFKRTNILDMKRLSTLIIAFFALFTVGTASATTIFVDNYGAKADGVTVNTKIIQKAINDCNQAGGGHVVLSSGIYVSGTIVLKDNVFLEIRRGAVLRGTLNPYIYRNIDPFIDATGQSRGECLVGAVGAKNIGIIGNGTIDGMGENFKAPLTRARLKAANCSEEDIKRLSPVRPFLVRFVKSEDITLTNVSLRNSAAWVCHLFECKGVRVTNLIIDSHVNVNNDGIDVDSCSDVQITECDIDTGDDAICLKSTSPKPCEDVTVRGCRLRSDWGAIKFGTESMGDFRNITISNCDIYDTKGGGIKILSVDGANIDNVRISKINMDNVDMPIFIRLGERLRTYREAEPLAVGSINNVVISGVTATTRQRNASRVNPPSGVLITGTPNARIGKVTLQNIKITLPGGGMKIDRDRVIAEDATRYPEFSFFGVQPAYGLNARHVDSLQMRGVSFSLTGRDERHLSNMYDVNHVPLEYPAPIN